MSKNITLLRKTHVQAVFKKYALKKNISNIIQRFSLSRICGRIKSLYLKIKYKKNAYPKSFNWDWAEINFNRIALVNLLTSKKADCSYLEIGCAGNNLFDSIPIIKKIGVDPVRGGNIRTTSDKFFEKNRSFFDVIFIDGLHTYDQGRKDVINSMCCLKPGGWVALHDMLPRNWIEHHVPMISSNAWTGDVWKVAFELSQTDGIDFKIIMIDHGVGVFKLTKNKPSLVDLREELKDKEFAYFYENIGRLPIVKWQDCLKWLRDN